jgi:acyl-coenzyme A thioesterase PaaI-like protein
MSLQKNIMQKLSQWLKDPSPWQLKILARVFDRIIPFNIPHGLSFISISDAEVKVKIPLKKKNMNHLKGVHACAIALIGEFTGGITIIRMFPVSEYRLILKSLNAQYLYQGRTDLIGRAVLKKEDVQRIHQALSSDSVCEQKMVTEIQDLNGKLVAKVTTTWQIKSWKQVQLK